MGAGNQSDGYVSVTDQPIFVKIDGGGGVSKHSLEELSDRNSQAIGRAS